MNVQNLNFTLLQQNCECNSESNDKNYVQKNIYLIFQIDMLLFKVTLPPRCWALLLSPSTTSGT